MMLDLLIGAALVLYGLGALGLFLYGLNCFVMIILFCRGRARMATQQSSAQRGAPIADDALPVVTTQLPIYNERFVTRRLLRAVCAFDYPAGKHEIQVLDDSTDDSLEENRRLVAELCAAGHDIHHMHRTDREGFKAGALAAGAAVARGTCFAIFDADFVPPPDFLRRTVPSLVGDPRCAFVQTRWGHRNADVSLLTRAQALGIDGHFVVEQSARAWNGLFLNFNGTAGVWRREAIDEAGGWSGDTITEDLDLSYRAQLAGWHGRFLFDVVTPAEIPTDLNAFKSQQHRWAKGSIQTALKLLPTIVRRGDLSRWKRLQAVLHLTHFLVHPLMLGMTLLVVPLLLLAPRILPASHLLPLFLLMLVSMAAPSSLYVFSQWIAHRDWLGRLRALPALTLLGVGLAVNNTQGVLEAVTGYRRHEFVRTPKLGRGAERTAALGEAGRGYRSPLGRRFAVELAVAGWAVLGFLLYLSAYKLLLGPLLLLQGAGLATVGTLSVIHHRRNGRARA